MEIQKAERFYKERVKEWETREKEREYERKREREKEKERERERRRLIAEQEDESDDDSRKRRRKSDMEDKRRRRRREKEEDSADRLKEDEEIVEATKRAEEEQQRQQEKQALELTSVPVANGSERPSSPEVAASEIKDDMEQDHDTDSAPVIHTGGWLFCVLCQSTCLLNCVPFDLYFSILTYPFHCVLYKIDSCLFSVR